MKRKTSFLLNSILIKEELYSNFCFKHWKKFQTEYLKPYLHGVLVTAEINLRQIVDEESQKCAIASLVALIHFMGPEYITPLRYKFLSTLRMLLKFIRPGFRKLTFEAWDAFIRK